MTQTTTVITGANTGIGFAAARELASRGQRVVLTSRNQQRGQNAIDRIRQDQPDADVHLADLDLASFDNVRASAADIRERFPSIDTLICNAGLNLTERHLTEDGIETMLQTNHFGHHLFTSILLPALLPSDDARVVVVSSIAHRSASDFPFDDLTLEHRWGRFYPYAASKLANIWFAQELHRRYADDGLAAFAVHPGAIRSGFGMDGDVQGAFAAIFKFLRLFMRSPANGAAPLVKLATDDDARQHSGRYFRRHSLRNLGGAPADAESAQRLWTLSNDVTGADWPQPATSDAA